MRNSRTSLLGSFLLPALCSALSDTPSERTAAPHFSTRGAGTSFLAIESLLGLKPLTAVYGAPLNKAGRRCHSRRMKNVMVETPDSFMPGVPNPLAGDRPDDVARPPAPKVIKGFNEIASQYDAFILDQYGVMHNGVKALPGAVDCFDHLVKSGKRIVILSNTSRRSASAIGKLPGMGFDVGAIQALVSSGEEAWQYVHETKKGQKCTFLTWQRESSGSDGYISGLDVTLAAVSEADFILCHGTEVIAEEQGPPRQVSYLRTGAVSEYAPVLEEGARRGLEMVVCNPDLKVALPDGSMGFMPGGVAQQYEAMGGKVTWFGKPHRRHFEGCLRHLGPDIPRHRVVHVGDSIEHDVRGATGAAIDSVFIAGGIHAADAGLTVGQGGAVEGELEVGGVAKVYEEEGGAATWACRTFCW